ncbi:hypothetical protein M885DRAFT_480473 [Pelagophyceae sp. CCMP2097]|nr:hypothetical protein M885DRAFT_480473 [Pelagophyceae sp. CCMP2097]
MRSSLTALALAGAAAQKHIALSNETVHWGYFSKLLSPVVTIKSGETVIVEMATHHACDDWDKMIKGDAGMESIYKWNEKVKREAFRGATGTGDGVHVLTGPIFVEEAEPGDLLKVTILDLQPRINAEGRAFGSNANAWWGYQARMPQADGSFFEAGDHSGTPGFDEETVTIYELVTDAGNGMSYAVPSYAFKWPTLTDPDGTQRNYIKYPGTCVPHDSRDGTLVSKDVEEMGWTKEEDVVYFDDMYPAKIPIKFHVGCMGLPPASHDAVDSIPPMVTGGNLDNRKIGVGTSMYYPVEVAGALLSMGDAHTAQGDSELDGTAIETSLTGKFKIELIKAKDFNAWQSEINFPLGETDEEYLIHAFTERDYLETYFENPSMIFSASTPIDKAMKNAFIQTRRFLMAAYELSDAEATTIITTGVDFAVTQVVDGNFGVHAVVPKSLFKMHAFVSLDCPAACVKGKSRRSRNLKFGFMMHTACSMCYEA